MLCLWIWFIFSFSFSLEIGLKKPCVNVKTPCFYIHMSLPDMLQVRDSVSLSLFIIPGRAVMALLPSPRLFNKDKQM